MVALVFCVRVPAETVLITGSNQGIGLEFAKEYAAKGWTVIATHRRATTPAALASLQQQYPARVRIEHLDVTDPAQIKALALKLKGQPIDVLLNNAALTRLAPLTDKQYRISKTALNSAMRLLAAQVKDEGIVVALFHPGGVQVESLGDLKLPGFVPPSEAVGKMIATIDGLRPKDSGRFLQNDGRDQPW